jgi:hypothetical protein
LQRHKAWRQYVPYVNALAEEYGVDRVFLLAALIANGTKASGMARFTQRFAQALRQYGTVEGAFSAVAPRASGRPWIPPRYLSGDLYDEDTGQGSFGGPGAGRKPPMTDEEKVLHEIYRSQLKESLTNPWVVIKDGRLRFSKSLEAPKGSLGIRRDDFLGLWKDVNETFELMIGRKAKAGEVANIVKKGWSDFTLKQWLSKRPGFKRGRLWASVAPALNGIGRDMFGDAWDSIPKKDRDELMRKAIVNDWTASVFEEKLRGRPEYLRSNEFRSNVAGLQGVYEQIYGIPQGGSMLRIEEAALARWTPDQFASHLRGLPGYTSSPEFQGRAMNVLEALGMITGLMPALAPGAPIPNPAAQGQRIPNSPRLPGAPPPVAPSLPGAGLTPQLIGV